MARKKIREVRGAFGRTAMLQTGQQDSPTHDLYHWLMTTTTPRFSLALMGGFIGANLLFALAYLACGPDGILNARPGSLADAFFFSVQTMATIGYGQMIPNSLAANLLVTGEAALGMFGIATAASLVFARFTRPTAGIRFSSKMVVTQHEGRPTLMFRVANQRVAPIHEARVLVVMARQEVTAEGHTYRRLIDLELVRSMSPVFQLSWTVMHVIDDKSPFFGTSPQALDESDVALSILFTGHHEGFRQTVHARHSYQAREIVWHQRFVDMFSRMPDGRTLIDHSKFDHVTDDGLDPRKPRAAQPDSVPARP